MLIADPQADSSEKTGEDRKKKKTKKNTSENRFKAN
jgi:hypothetical protein